MSHALHEDLNKYCLTAYFRDGLKAISFPMDAYTLDLCFHSVRLRGNLIGVLRGLFANLGRQASMRRWCAKEIVTHEKTDMLEIDVLRRLNAR